MPIVIAAVLAATAFVVLTRLLWLAKRPARHTTLITIAAALLVIGLAVLTLTGRLHWLAALAAALAPFLRRGLRLIRYLPWLSSLLAAIRSPAASGSAGAGRDRTTDRSGGRERPFRDNGAMSRAEALEVLGLGTQPTREEIISAHRHLIQKLHPDRGGTKYLAQQLNEAKHRLLEES